MEEGEHVSLEEYYFKGVATFKTDNDKYKWMERKVFVTESELINWEKLKTIVYMV